MPTRRTSGSRCAASARRSRSTRTDRSISRPSAGWATGSSRASPAQVAQPSCRMAPMADRQSAERAAELTAELTAERAAELTAERAAERAADLADQADDGRTGLGAGFGLNFSFRTRLTIGLVAASLIPLAGFGAILLALDSPAQSATLGRLLLFVLVVAAIVAILLAYLLAADLTAPLRAIAAAVERASAGDLSTPIIVPGE